MDLSPGVPKFLLAGMPSWSLVSAVLCLQIVVVVPEAGVFSVTGTETSPPTVAETGPKKPMSLSNKGISSRDSPLTAMNVNLSSLLLIRENSYPESVQIDGILFWQLNSEAAVDRVEIMLTSPEASCAQDYAATHKSLPGNSTFWEIPRQPHSTERRILKFGCTYNVEVEVSPCFDCSAISYNFTVGRCVGQLCRCSYCHAHLCRCPRPELETPWEQRLWWLESDEREARLRWRYRRGSEVKLFFLVSVYWHDAADDEPEGAIDTNQLDITVEYEPEVSDYNVTFDVRPKKTYCVQVVAVGDNGTSCSDATPLRFTSNGTASSDDEPASPESGSPFLALVLTASTLMALVSIGGYVGWRRWLSSGGRATGLHALQKHRVQYQCSASSKSSCLTKGTYLSTEREDINVLYVEQEIQEARDKGIVDFFEISYGRLQIGPEIGKGAFGRVCIATAEAIAATPGTATVAVKYLRENPKEQEKEDFLAEIATMKKAGRHPNVVTMLACCTLQQPYCMVMEYVACGDLLNYLRRLRAEYEKVTGRMVGLASSEPGGDKLTSLEWANREKNASSEKLIDEADEERQGRTNEATEGRDDKGEGGEGRLLGDPADRGSDAASNCSKATEETAVQLVSGESGGRGGGWEADTVCLDPLELQSFALQIASGMNHLSSRDIVHRDLAARNVLIDQSKRLKVADFGLSRSGVYVTQRGGRVPLRWLSLEAIRDNLYSTASDVWAFGVVLWEICTLGGFPYSAVSDKDLFRYLLRNNRLERPLHCSEELYAVMMSCWSSDPKARPDFGDLCETLEHLGQHEHIYVNFDLEATSSEALPPATQQLRDEERSAEMAPGSLFPDFDC